MKKTRNISESVDISEAVASAKVDEAAGVIRDVVLMTANKTSKNKTRYMNSALSEATTRYEGAKMYLDHPRTDELQARRGNRSVRDLAGTFGNLRVSEGKLYADVNLLEHNKAVAISVAKNPPKGTGLSLRDRGRVRDEGGVTLVEGFEGDNFSIDLVVDASLNAGLFESVDQGGEAEMKELTIEKLKEGRADLVESIRNEAVADLKKQLEEAGEKTLAADKLVMLAEAKMPAEFRDAIRSVVLKKEVTIEEAKSIVSAQVALFDKTSKGVPTPNATTPAVTGAQGRQVTESAKMPSDDEFLAALKA